MIHKLRKFESIHNNETCYIFGDGPSIKWFDLSNFTDHPAISCNNFFFHNDFGKLKIKYYAIVPPRLFWPKWMINRDAIKKLQPIANEYSNLIKSRQDIQFFLHVSNMLSMHGHNVNYLYKSLPSGSRKHSIDKLTKIASVSSGAFHATLLLAYYLGFKKIYLVGFDGWTIQPARGLHWYELGEGELFEPTNFATDFLEALQSEIDIYTISKDGESCNVKNISYESYTGKVPSFKENYELLSDKYLKVLSSFPEYKIFPR